MFSTEFDFEKSMDESHFSNLKQTDDLSKYAIFTAV